MITVPVPALTWQQGRWAPEAEGISRTQRTKNTGRYSSAIPARIRDWEPDIPGELASEIDDATAALAGFGASLGPAFGGVLPPTAALTAILLRSESASSSQIEQLTVSARGLARAALGDESRANARQVLSNVHAMESALALADELRLEAVLEVHRTLLLSQPFMQKHAGVLRSDLVWVGGSPYGPLGADYVAPQASLLSSSLDDLFAFIRREDMPILMQAAVAHAQFETIHPFADGNGRTGRALIHAILRAKGLLSSAVVPLSAALLQNTPGYFADLQRFREGDAGPIIQRFCEAALLASRHSTDLIEDLTDWLRESESKLAGIRSDAKARLLLPQLIAQPVLNTERAKQLLGTEHDTPAARALGILVERGVLKETTGYRRNRVYEQSQILELFDGFAERFRRSAGSPDPA